MVSLNDINELNDKVIKRIVDKHRGSEFPRLKKLADYYNANNEIKRRLMKDPSKDILLANQLHILLMMKFYCRIYQ